MRFFPLSQQLAKRFAFYGGRRCRASPIRDVAKELRLDWHTVKALEQQYMREQLGRVGTPGPRVLGLDEVSIKKGHTYRIVVSDLIRQRPIWFGGTDRSEASLDQFYAWLGPRKATRIRLVVMDMGKPFRLATAHHAPQASILFDKFHILRHLGDALDEVRTREYARVAGRQADLGSITPGKLADLVILDADPLADIRNIVKVHRVIKAGNIYEPAQLMAATR